MFLGLVFIFNNKPSHTTLWLFEELLVIGVILLFYIVIYIYAREHNEIFFETQVVCKKKDFFLLCLFVCTSNLESLQLKAAVDSWNAIVTDVRSKIAFLKVSCEVYLE